MSEGKKAFYLFCFARADRLPATIEGEGLDERSTVWAHRDGDVAAVLSEVSLADFTGPEAEARLHDLAWLTPRALRHEQVVERIAQCSPVLPARFGTIFTSMDSLARLLAAHRGGIRQFLDRAEGREEWGLKGFLDRPRAREWLVDEELAGAAARLSSSSPGMRYMQERRIRAEADNRLRRWLAETSGRLREELSRHATQTVERRVLASGSTDDGGEMVLNWAFLVPKGEADSLRSESDRLGQELAERGLAFEWSGPFPPYSFTPELGEPKS